MLVNTTSDLGVVYNGFRFDDWNTLEPGNKYKITFYNGKEDKNKEVVINAIYMVQATRLALAATLTLIGANLI